MRVGVLGTGMVGRAHAARLTGLGHQVTVGTRNVAQATGEGSFAQWLSGHPEISVETFGRACAEAELLIVALNGQAAPDVLAGLQGELRDTVVVDISNPLDFSTGELRLFVSNTDSLGERLQRAAPRAHVVKTLCTVTAEIQVDPAGLGGGQHDMFVAGNGASAKAAVVELLRQYGWRSILDLGDITAARGMEMMLPMWLKIMQASGTARFNYRLVTDS